MDSFKEEKPEVLAKKRSIMEKRSNIFIALAVIFLLLGVGGLIIACGMKYATHLAKLEYGIVFDAGSSHTTMYLYHWDSEKINNTGKVEQIDDCEIKDELDTFASDPSAAGSSLTECLNNASKEIPWAIKGYTPVYLGATAGMRLLREQDEAISKQIFESVRKEVVNSGFQVDDPAENVKIISGQDEGVGLWVTANYVAGNLGNILSVNPVLPSGNSSYLGVLDLGGASTQITYSLPADTTWSDENSTEKVELFSNQLTLYSNSFLCFGVNEMKGQLYAILAKQASYAGDVNHPCLAEGIQSNKTYAEVFKSVCTNEYAASSAMNTTMTYIGTSDSNGCAQLVESLNHTGSPLNSFTLPTLPDRFLARGGFFYTMNDLKVLNESRQTTHSEFMDATNTRCGLNSTELLQKEEYDPKSVCANAHYINYLLSNVYKLPESYWSGTVFANKLSDVDMGWTLGYMTNITSALPHVPKLDLFQITTPIFIAVVVITSILIVIGLIAVVFACKFRHQQYRSLQSHQRNEPF